MTPSPKEKARELFKDMYTIIFDIDNGASVMHDQARYDAAKRAAVKCIDELVDCTHSEDIIEENCCPVNGNDKNAKYTYEYWEKVKQELEKL